MGASSSEQEHQPPCVGHDYCGVIASILLFGAMFSLPVMLFLSPIIWPDDDPPPPPQYSIAVAAASGLDYNATTAPAPPPALSPAFNITVCVASRSKDPACLHPATSVQVSYLRVPLAGGRVMRPAAAAAAAGLCCAPPWGSADHAVVAKGKAVAVPGYLVDSLAEDVRAGEAVFEVTLMRPHRSYWDVLTCWGKIGDAAALQEPCTQSLVHAGRRLLAAAAAARPRAMVITSD